MRIKMSVTCFSFTASFWVPFQALSHLLCVPRSTLSLDLGFRKTPTGLIWHSADRRRVEIWKGAGVRAKGLGTPCTTWRGQTLNKGDLPGDAHDMVGVGQGCNVQTECLRILMSI